MRISVSIALLAVTTALLAAPSAGRLFRSADGRTTIKILSPDQLELTTDARRNVCSYSRYADSLRVVATSLGSVQILIFKVAPEGLIADDGTQFFDEQHVGVAGKGFGFPAICCPHPSRNIRMKREAVTSLERELYHSPLTQAAVQSLMRQFPKVRATQCWIMPHYQL